MTVWQRLIEETLKGVGLYAFFGIAIKRVTEGVGSQAENELVECVKKVAMEYQDKALLKAKQLEAAEIEERQRQFKEKWGVSTSGHTLVTLKRL